MRLLIGSLLNIITAPFRWLSSAVYRKYAAIRLEVAYGRGRAYISSQWDSSEYETTYLVAAYLLFLARYFFICDKRQIEPVGTRLAEYIRTGAPPAQLASALFETVHGTLNQNEKRAVAGLFSFPNLPPLTYTDEATPSAKLARYTLTTYKAGDIWSLDFHMSTGPDIVLLPITVGLLYHYVSDKIEDNNKPVLNNCISQFLAEQQSSDCRSHRDATRIPNTIIANNFGT
jgi:hypothetical protein